MCRECRLAARDCFAAALASMRGRCFSGQSTHTGGRRSGPDKTVTIDRRCHRDEHMDARSRRAIPRESGLDTSADVRPLKNDILTTCESDCHPRSDDRHVAVQGTQLFAIARCFSGPGSYS